MALSIVSITRLSPPFSAGAESGQSGPLVGTWTNITRLEASPPRNTLQAQPIGRLTLEAKDANA